MADRVTAAARSAMMGRVRSKDTGPELTVRRVLHKSGYRFRLHRRDLPGRPDIYLPRHEIAIFVHGCFWHGHNGCKRARLPTTSVAFWREKIGKNVQRDERARVDLEARGIKVVVFWSCELKDEGVILSRISALIEGKR